MKKVRPCLAPGKAVEKLSVVVEIPRESLTQVAAPPAFITQQNCEHVGLSRRQFLELLRAPDFPLPHVRRGKVRLIETTALVEWLRGQATPLTPESAPVVANDSSDDVVDELAAELGLRRVRGGT